VPTPKRIIKDK